jgi:two-component system NtrC family sensor kinase
MSHPTIAIIDDDDDTCDLLGARLRKEGYRVACYHDAHEALADMLRGNRPHLILLDLMLPGMNGWEFRVEQKRQPALIDVPVIALSGETSPFAAAIDASAYLSKPVDLDRLWSVVEHVLLSSERRRVAARSVQFERMSSLSMLVGSVGHEIRAPLARMLRHLNSALGASKVPTPMGASESGYADHEGERTGLREANLQQLLERVRSDAERVAFAVGLLDTFNDDPSDEERLTDPLRALDAATRLAAHQMENRAHVVAQLEPVPLVRANEGRLAHVILNLLMNAAQAIPEGAPDEHEIRVRVREVPMRETRRTSAVPGAAGGATRLADEPESEVLVEVEDTGCGMAPELVSQIFEPFYTTKPAGTGTGLGLTISRDIVAQFGGTISASSKLGKGSVFGVHLPVHRAARDG